jgi:hypothetical protein
VATFEQETQERQRLSTALSALASIEPQSLVREEVLGRDLNFLGGLPYFQRTLRLFKDLAESNLDNVPHQNLQQLATLAEQARDRFKRVQEFSVSQYQSNPTAMRDSLVADIRDSYDNIFQQVSPMIAYSVRKGTDFERLEKEARETVSQLRVLVTEQENSRRAMLTEVEGTLEKVRRAAQEVGVAQHAIHFKDEAVSNSKSADRWLITTGILTAVTLAFGVYSLYFIVTKTPDFTPTQSVQLAIAKVIVFSVLLSATLWTGRTYRAARHNYVVNKHRQNALSTFETFAKAASDDATKSAVLLQATNCIFSAQQSGYITQESEGPAYPQILEIIRKAAEGREK